MKTRLLLPALAVLTGLACAAPASAQSTYPADDRAVTATATGRGVTFHFSPSSATARAAYKQIAGKRVYLLCLAVSRPGGQGSPRISDTASVEAVRAPKRRGPVTFGFSRARDFDACAIVRASDDRSIASASLSASGRVYLEESLLASDMISATMGEDGTTPSITEAVVAGDGRVVGMTGPDGTPPKGKIGYWTDGQKVAVVGITKAGRRLFWESEGDVVRSNTIWLIG